MTGLEIFLLTQGLFLEIVFKTLQRLLKLLKIYEEIIQCTTYTLNNLAVTEVRKYYVIMDRIFCSNSCFKISRKLPTALH